MIAYCVSKRSSNTTIATTTNTLTLQQKLHSAYTPTGRIDIEPPTTTNTPTLQQKPHSAYSPTGPIDIEPPTTTNTPPLPQKPHSAYSPDGPTDISRVQNPAIDSDYPPQYAAYSTAAQSRVNQDLYETVQDT